MSSPSSASALDAEVAALADCISIMLEDIRKKKQTRSAVILADDTDRAGDSGAQETAKVILAHDDGE